MYDYDDFAFYKAIGQKIRQLRVDRGLTQKQLAHEMNLTSTTLISALENGRGGIYLHDYVRLCKKLNVSPAELLREDKI